MKKAKAIDKKTGLLVGLMSAASLTEEQRYAYDYRCPDAACDCKVHWRRTTEAKENTEIRPATWVKNPSSKHVEGCFHDYERIASETQEYTYFVNGQFHVRINFPVGAARQDTYPLRAGYLTEQQLRAAENSKQITPFGSLKDLIKFVEKNLGPIDGETLPDLVMHYQGKEAHFSDKIIGSLDYARLYEASLPAAGHTETASALTIVKLDHEIDKNKHGKHRFICVPQEVKIDGRKHHIAPVIVCPSFEPAFVDAMKEAAKNGQVMAVMARPFSQGINFSRPFTPVYLTIAKDRQVAPVSDNYWKLPPVPYMKDFKRRQYDIFSGPSNQIL